MLSIKGLIFGFAWTWGLCMLFCGWTSMFGWGNAFVEMMASIYIGYDASFWGGVIGGLWGLLDGGLFGLIFGLIYNATAK